MLHKWKFILTNWINCYFNNSKTEECISIDTLLTIISHLHKKSLDESKSSILEAQTVEEFILEKYPEFKFEDGTVEPTNEEEVYIVASLLLFFVCVNSKDVDIKHAMCSKLSPEDQETIMKFSKCLMECSPVTCRDVLAAIIEACGEDIAAGSHATVGVTETPPALRSLHGELRRLQAALDAERFDRNYLQEELARTNRAMEKLVKDKEQYKQDIMELKARISLCCGQEAEAHSADGAGEGAARLQRQLHDAEERLVHTQEMLDDITYERDTYKAKVEELKQERDKWLTVSQEETSRACQLAEELEVERRRAMALHELVAELRQHRKNNGLDTSQFECDDPDASLHSLHNASVCSEACANVIEVQLSEERAKIVVLKQQIDSLQDQFKELSQKAENEKMSLEGIISEKDNDIFNLKHRINEEIEEKNNMKAQYDDDISKLNNEMNELEQRLKENTENSRASIEQKMQEIQTLQEEKLSLLQSLSDETTKLETIIKNLKTDIETEKNMKSKMKEDYDNQLMKLNEKVLNRNNELVELQNKIFENGDVIEKLQMSLKKEKEINSELSNKCNNDIAQLNEEKTTLERNLHQKTEEAKELQKRLLQNVAVFAEFNKEIDDLKAANEDLVENYRILEDAKKSLLAEIRQRDDDVEGIRKEIENITNIFSEEKDKFVRNVEERNTTINALQIQLHDEIQYKIRLESELQHLMQAKTLLSEELADLSKSLNVCKAEIQDKDRTIYALDLYLKEEKHINKNLKAENEKLNEDLNKLSTAISAKSSEMNMLEEKLENDSVRFEDELRKKEEALELTNEKLLVEMQEKEVLQGLLITINEEKDLAYSESMERRRELEDLQVAYTNLSQEMEQNVIIIESLGNKIERETKKYLQLEIDFDKQTSNMMAKLNDTEKKLKEVSAKSKVIVEDKRLQIETLKIEFANLNKTIEAERENMSVVENEREALKQKLDEELCYKNKIEKEYQNQCAMVENLTSQFTGEIALKSDEIIALKDEVEKLLKTVEIKTEELKNMEAKLVQDTDASRELAYLKGQEIKKLLQKIEELEAFNDELEQELKKEVASKIQAIDALQRENEQLHFTIEEDNSNHEIMIKERDNIIECLEERVRVITVQLESLRKDYETSTLTWEKTKVDMREELDDKDNEIEKLKEDICLLRNELDQNVFNAEKVESDLKRQVEEIIRQNSDADSKKKDQIKKYIEEINQYEIRVINLERDDEALRVELKNEKAAKEILENEKAGLLKRNESLIRELYQEQSLSLELKAEKNALLQEKSMLTEELLGEKSARQILDEKQQAILSEKQVLEQQLFEETTIKNMLVEEKDNLTAQLVEERNIKQQLEHGEIGLQEVTETLQHRLNEELRLRSNLEEERDYLIREKNDSIETLAQLNQQIAMETAAKDLLQEEVNRLTDSLKEEILSKEQVCKEKQTLFDEYSCLKKEIADLKLIEETLTREKEQLNKEKQLLQDESSSLKDTISELNSNNESLLRDKDLLSEQNHNLQSDIESLRNSIVELQTIHDNMSEDKQSIFDENSSLKINFAQLLEEKQKMFDENNTLKNDIVKLKVIQDTLTHENEHFCEEKQSLCNENTNLKNGIEELKAVQATLTSNNEQINEEKQKLYDENSSLKDALSELKILHENITIVKEELDKENQSVINENSSLKNNITELNTIKEMLIHDKEVLGVEKETLMQNLSVEKAARDELESEKSSVSDTLKELQEKFEIDMKVKEEQLSTVSSELQQVKLDVKKHEDKHLNIVSVVESGFGKLLQNIKGEKIDNDVLQKLITVENEEGMSIEEKCHLLINVADTLRTELSVRQNLAMALEHESTAVDELKDIIKQKEMQVFDLQTEVKRLQQVVYENQVELSKQTEIYNTTMDAKVKNIQTLQQENKSLNNELNDVKVQLEVKVHSLKEKLIDNENLTDKLKKTYECQIENLNVMITKLTSYLKEKTAELESLRKEKDKLQQVIDENNRVVTSLEEEVKIQKQNQEKLISDFESERQVIKNMVTVTESIMEDQKVSLTKVISDHEKTIETLQTEKKALEELIEATNKKADELVQEKQVAFETVFKELTEIRKEKETIEKEMTINKEFLNKEIAMLKEELTSISSKTESLDVQNKVIMKEKKQIQKELQREVEALKEEIKAKVLVIEKLETRNEELNSVIDKLKDDLLCLQEKDNELKIKKDSLESELLNRIEKLTKVLSDDTAKNDKFKSKLQEKLQSKSAVQEKVKVLTDEIIDLVNEKNEYISKLDEVRADWESSEIKAKEKIDLLKMENANLHEVIEDNKTVIYNLETLVKRELEHNQKLREDNTSEKLNIENKCSLLQEYQTKAEKQLQDRDREIYSLKEQVKTEAKLARDIENLKEELTQKDAMVAKIARDKDEVINTLNKELVDEKAIREQYQKQLEAKTVTVYELRQKLEEVKSEAEVLESIKKENEELIKAVGQRETFAAIQERLSSHKLSSQTEKDLRDRHQVSTPTSDLTHSSMESFKTITDLEKIIHDKNRTITALQSDITYLKSLMADSENKLLDVTKELEITKENCEQLSCQLKKIVHQKNEEIADLKKQVSKMSVTENRASQIIKVSAKYQAIILKRIAEIKSNTILKELTNFGNTANSDSELKRSLNTGAITMEDLENFLETTDRHLKRCSEKQVLLQKERDRLIEVNRINESEIINLKKFLTELSVSFKTFSSIKDLYSQKLSRVVSVQRTVRREILGLEGHVTDAMMCKLERGYAAVMQDLSECSMNLERWVERCIARTISAEKIKQAFINETERASMAPSSYQNASLEVQLDELENSFQKLLEEVVRAQKGEGAREPQAVTVMEVRAEYEDKLNRMKAKMKQLYQEQIQVFKDKQREEIATLERELQKTRDRLAESSRAYEEHIKALTTELWSVGEKFLMKKDEAEWLRKKQRSGSLMSLQHVHSAGLVPNHEEPPSRPSDTHSLRSLPVHTGNAREKRGRGLHMSDEEGEVFDNRCLKELATPRRESNAGQRLSELRWRNSFCPPHLKSSYPAETQFAHAFDEDDIKNAGAVSIGRASTLQRKEVGITAYKKPGPPTPSKQAGRLSATDSELRESLRVEVEPAAARKTSTPSRLRSLFRSGRSDAVDGTPRRRLSNIFRKK
ncbi:cytadherence high molecular weight protein 2-like isoform X2 [Pectinophora gossypiella]|uniref:cytadherence high molecular weight protein 2-like isoform X2 n=1 Tax=Pectinophora gossypiella TaxID=13191 RepID=UPI00214F0860|nr:cytadherence high molecular weight protein 2-like isoform X2 [Pectinophora gossypiella]